MSDVASRGQVERRKRPERRQRSIYQVHYALRKSEEVMATPMALPADARAYRLQVAGHQGDTQHYYRGILQLNNGRILKPILKESLKREIDFYERVTTSDVPDLVALKEHVPRYYGCRVFTFGGHSQRYVELEDLARRMLLPCIMDVKIGKRTWDPLASAEKKAKEEEKYARCKQQFAFCIPGYQVHVVSRGQTQLVKHGKEHGKRLHGECVRTAIRTFLNCTGKRVCRALLVQLMCGLWRIQRWCGSQRAVRLYAASLLLVYDAARPAACCARAAGTPGPANARSASWPALRPRSSPTNEPANNFSGQLTPTGPKYKKVNPVPLGSMTQSLPLPKPIASPWTEALEKLKDNHSFEHNYEDKLCKIKMNYRSVLDQLSDDAPPNPWGAVKIIDFAHAFFNEDEDMGIDENFKEGVDSFVALFEELLAETDDQV